jgi:hypothetical protein
VRSAAHDRQLTCGIIVTIVVAGVISALFAPGRFNPDGLDMYNQALHDVYTDWHSPILTGLWGTFDLPPEFVLLLFVTMVMVAGVLLLATEIPVRWAVVAVTLVCVWPMTLGVLTTVSKDAWFAGFFLSGAATSAYAARRSGRARWILVAAAGTSFWLAVAARPNAIVVVAAVLLLGWPLAAGDGRGRWLSRQGAKRLGITIVLSIGLLLSQRAFSDVVVRPAHLHPEQPGYQFDLAALSLRTGTMLLPASSLNPGADLDDIRKWFDESDGGYLWFSPDPPVRFGVDAAAVAELRTAWLDAIREHPVEFAEHRLQYARSLLGFGRPTYVVWEVPQQPAMWGFGYHVHPPFAPWFRSWVERTVAHFGWYSAFRAWMWVLVLLVVGFSPRGRRSVAVRTLVAAGGASLLSFMLAGTSSGFRYAWFTMLCALLSLAIGLTWLARWAWQRYETRPTPAARTALIIRRPLA